jgi:hypothetical protein
MLLHCLPIATTRHLDWFISPQSAAGSIQGSIYVFDVSFSRVPFHRGAHDYFNGAPLGSPLKRCA